MDRTDRIEEILQHYGTKGMRWGVRKKRSTSSDYKTSMALKKKRLSEMSNDELRTLSGRLQLEQSASSLNPSITDRARKKVGATLKQFGNRVLSDAVAIAATTAVEAIFKKKGA